MRTLVIYVLVMPIIVAMAFRLGIAALGDINAARTPGERQQRINEWQAIGMSSIMGATIILGLLVYFVVPE